MTSKAEKEAMKKAMRERAANPPRPPAIQCKTCDVWYTPGGPNSGIHPGKCKPKKK
jgi:hypothetical protein